MRASETSPHARYMILLAAFLGGIALFGVVFVLASPPHNGTHITEQPDRLTLASGGLLAGAAPAR